MKKSEFLELVYHELEVIKTMATSEEIGRLDFSTFDHTRQKNCIYGQMTGGCYSRRAREIHPKIYNPEILVSHDLYIDLVPFDKSRPGLESYVPFSNQVFNLGGTDSPLERYLYMSKSTKHKQIIEYLKGEKKTIKL